jgi:hypothetical protein
MNKRNTTKPKDEVAQQTEQETDQQQETPQEEAQQTEQQTEQETDQEAEKGEAQEAEAKKTGKSEKTEAYKEGSRVDQLLRLYPKYKRAYVSKKGFVYPEDTSEWQRGDAVLYENKYFTK